jgi:acetyl-CoA C-acetyltransferase
MERVFITGASRTPMGGFQGIFSERSAADLGGDAIRAALAQGGQPAVDELLMGCVLPAGQGQAPPVRLDSPRDWAKTFPPQR